MSRILTFEIPDKTKAISISIVAENGSGQLTLTTRGVDTNQISEGKPIVIELDDTESC